MAIYGILHMVYYVKRKGDTTMGFGGVAAGGGWGAGIAIIVVIILLLIAMGIVF